MNGLKQLLCGMLVGISSIVPGMSGGTMMVVLGIFDRVVKSVGDLRKRWRESLPFLLHIAIGAGVGIILFSRVLGYLLDTHYLLTNFLFIGIILGSMPLVWHRATEDHFRWNHLIFCAITLALMLYTAYVVPGTPEVVFREVNLWQGLWLAVSGGVAAICMIIPGISGSFVLLLFGTYETLMAAISEWNFAILIPTAIGVVVGILAGCKVISALLRRYPQATYFAILGFMIGSVPTVIEKIRLSGAFVTGAELWIAVAVLFFGVAISYLPSSPAVRRFFAKRGSSR